MLPQDAPPVSFKVGEQVRISGGPFASFSGVVEEIDDARSSMRSRSQSLGDQSRWRSNLGRWRSSPPRSPHVWIADDHHLGTSMPLGGHPPHQLAASSFRPPIARAAASSV
jgi:KOW motif